MSDNLLLNAGAGGSKLATAQLVFSGDTADFQICSLTILTGAEGAWAQTLIVGGAGVVGAGVQRMTLASDDPAVAKLTTIDVDTGAIATSVATLALETGGHIEEAADHVHSIDGKITACNTGAIVISSGTVTTVTTVTTVGAVTAITNALPAGDNNIGNVDIVTMPADTFAADAQAYGKGVLVQGDDGTDRRALLVGTDGHLQVDVLAAPSTAVTGTFWQATQPVSGTFWQATQPISAAALPLPTGAATSALQGGGLPAALAAGGGLKVEGVAGGVAVPVSGTFYQATQPVSAAALPLPTGASTSALQGGGLPAALGAGGGMKVDGSGTALPVTGTITAVTAITNALPAGTNMLGSIIGQQSSSVVYDGATACTIYRASGVAAGGAPGTDALIAADGTRKFRILALFLKATAATLNSVYLATTTDLDVLGNAANPIPLAVDADGNVDSGFVLPWNPGGWTETSTVNEALNLISSAAQDIIWAITYIKVA